MLSTCKDKEKIEKNSPFRFLMNLFFWKKMNDSYPATSMESTNPEIASPIARMIKYTNEDDVTPMWTTVATPHMLRTTPIIPTAGITYLLVTNRIWDKMASLSSISWPTEFSGTDSFPKSSFSGFEHRLKKSIFSICENQILTSKFVKNTFFQRPNLFMA